jgi:hypothetical protein
MRILTLVPLRPDGVRATLEFIFSVHPSSSLGDDKPPDDSEKDSHKQGANITTEAVKVATRLFGAPPRSIKPEEWFAGIGPQLLAMLDGEQGQELIKVASHIICSGFLSKKHLGAPGEQFDRRASMSAASANGSQARLRGQYLSSPYCRLSILHFEEGLLPTSLRPSLTSPWTVS